MLFLARISHPDTRWKECSICKSCHLLGKA